MDGNLPWSLVFIGMFIAVVIEILQIPVLPLAIGLYLPLELSSAIMLGGAVRFITDKGLFRRRSENSASGILFCSGLIAGEGIVGILLAILAVAGIADRLNVSSVLNTGVTGSLVLLALLLAAVYFAGTKRED